MRLAELWQVRDWRQLRDTLPQSIFAGWRAHYRREPWGSAHFYRFFAHAFVLLVRAFHLPEYACDLTSGDFLWWVQSDATAADDRDEFERCEAEAVHAVRVIEMRKKILADQAAEAKAKRKGDALP